LLALAIRRGSSWRLHRQVGGFLALEDAINVTGREIAAGFQ
jgi:hypothetical protein